MLLGYFTVCSYIVCLLQLVSFANSLSFIVMYFEVYSCSVGLCVCVHACVIHTIAEHACKVHVPLRYPLAPRQFYHRLLFHVCPVQSSPCPRLHCSSTIEMENFHLIAKFSLFSGNDLSFEIYFRILVSLANRHGMSVR